MEHQKNEQQVGDATDRDVYVTPLLVEVGGFFEKTWGSGNISPEGHGTHNPYT